MLIPIDNISGGGWGNFKIHIPIFERAFERHDNGYDDIIAGTSPITLKELDRQFLRNMLRAAAAYAWQTKSGGDLVKYTRYAWECYRIVRAWAITVRRPLENWRPGQGAIKV